MTTNLVQTVKLLSTAYPKSEENDTTHDIVLRMVLSDSFTFNGNAVENLLALVRDHRMSEEYWVAVFEALIVGNARDADHILCTIMEKLSRRKDDRYPVHPAIIVGLLRAEVWCATVGLDNNEKFRKILPGHLGDLLRAQAEFHQEDEPCEKWIVSQFSDVLSKYLQPDHGVYFDRASAILKPLHNVCLRPQVQNKLLQELVNRLTFNMTQTAQVNMMWEWHKRTEHCDQPERLSAEQYSA